MTVADIIALRSQCDSRRIGAVIVSADNAYSVVGYNGPPAGWSQPADTTCRDWCPRLQTGNQTPDYDNCVTVHAEANALARADFSRIHGGTLYVSSACCWSCGKQVANSGVSRVVMHVNPQLDAHRDPFRTIRMLEESGVRVTIWGENEEAALQRRRMYSLREGSTNA